MLYLNGRFLLQGLTGVQRYAREIALALAAMPDRPAVTLLAPPGATGLEAFAPLSPRIIGRATGQAWEQLELPRAARDGLLLSLGNTAPLLAGAAQAVVVHDAGVFDTPESYGWAFRAWYRSLQRLLVLRGARMVTVSRFSAGRLSLHLGIEPPATLEGGEHILRAEADPAILARHGLASGRYALVVGTGAAHKNLAALHAAMAELRARGLVLAVAGAKDAAVFSAGSEAPGEVCALGRVSDGELRALYDGALCLLFPSRYEGFGLPPLEAMWCGCPVLAGPAGAVPEVCGDAALYFDADEPGSLAALIGRLADDPSLRARLASAGRARAAEFSWEMAARRLLGFARA
ncbi:MAG TPA: glycosyltransferase family 1 protein [Roseococcus sp.]|jgi:glycosyltransferase involved in cell wall biosynthesis|nr:glycosyltransferase family 1 protein [Roseococcus sp.]